MKLNMTALAATLVLAVAPAAFAVQDTDTASSPAAVDIVASIAIANTGGLHFGDVVSSGALGTVAVDVAGARSESGGVTLGNGASARAASFDVTGDPGGLYTVTLPASILISGGGADMTVDGFDDNATGTLTAGAESFDVGATLHVNAAQVAGAYTGSFDVIVTYN